MQHFPQRNPRRAHHLLLRLLQIKHAISTFDQELRDLLKERTAVHQQLLLARLKQLVRSPLGDCSRSYTSKRVTAVV